MELQINNFNTVAEIEKRSETERWSFETIMETYQRDGKKVQ